MATPSMSLFGYPQMSPKAKDLYSKLVKFMNDEVYPAEKTYFQQRDELPKWSVIPIVEELKEKAKKAGLWNLFLPVENDGGKYGAGLTNLEYASLCEETGKVIFAPEVFNCAAPDTGNMEIIARFGTKEQKEKWLVPLLEGKIRSCFGMTEPAVASSDASNIRSSIVRDGNDYVVNGRKWWTSGAGDPRCKVCVFMGKTREGGDKYTQQSMILIPMNAPGVKLMRPLHVFGFDDAPHGHLEVDFVNVRVPASSILLGEGRGFEIAQARLGPGRIHHCMRAIGVAERCLELLCERSLTRVAFGKKLMEHGTLIKEIADSRIELDQARLYVMYTAHKMDTQGNKNARTEIHAIKVAIPNTAIAVVDRAIQVFGGAGVSQDFPLAYAYASLRTLRIADGPDEVHREVVARGEIRKAKLRVAARL